MLRSVSAVTIRIGLDADAQTRVDLTVATSAGRGSRGGNVRRIASFLRALDRRLTPRKRR